MDMMVIFLDELSKLAERPYRLSPAELKAWLAYRDKYYRPDELDKLSARTYRRGEGMTYRDEPEFLGKRHESKHVVRTHKRARVEAAAGGQASEVLKAIRQRGEAKPVSARVLRREPTIRIPLKESFVTVGGKKIPGVEWVDPALRGPMELLKQRFLEQQRHPRVAQQAEMERKRILGGVMKEKREKQQTEIMARKAKAAEARRAELKEVAARQAREAKPVPPRSRPAPKGAPAAPALAAGAAAPAGVQVVSAGGGGAPFRLPTWAKAGLVGLPVAGATAGGLWLVNRMLKDRAERLKAYEGAVAEQ